MRVITPGYKYFVSNFEKPENGQEIQFLERSAEKTINDGTTNEELLKVLISRLSHLNDRFPCRENSIAITKLEEALMWLNKRTENRSLRGVEGKQVP